jgi:hypothetical protein
MWSPLGRVWKQLESSGPFPSRTNTRTVLDIRDGLKDFHGRIAGSMNLGPFYYLMEKVN